MGPSSKLICMNRSCGTANSLEWKRGWPLRSGGFALLCCPCGSAYENSVFCNTFHFAESGWRECSICGKHLHCGCIASACSLELLDYGGIGCTTCWNTSRLSSIQGHGIHNAFGSSSLNIAGHQQSTHAQNSEVGNRFDERELMQLCNLMKANEPNFLPHSQRRDTDSSVDHTDGDEVRTVVEIVSGATNATQPSTMPPITEAKDMHDSQTDPSMSITLGTSSGTPNSVLPSQCVPGRRFQFHPYLPQTPKVAPTTSSEMDKGYSKQVRVARPPGYGRGKNQLLPRYWPRITDQELQQLSGDLNSTIVPLFEKVLSASDAGRIGRLVLPKACAETYFPPISQSEGLPLRVQDVKGKEWTFQFRFWPNNNSRMYVLEGVTPCIQSMQLQAGDTVTFSRIDPGGKIVMGFRKSSNSDSQCSLLPNGSPSGDASISGVTENFPIVGNFSSYIQTHKESKDPREPVLIADKKRARNIGAKTKRLLMHSEDAMELRISWEEAQDLLRPAPSVKPVIVTIEGNDFEEYNEPPVFGKKTIFTAQSSGEQEQWAQCDDCLKWRRLPVDVLLPPTWTCSDNVWDPNRCSCSVPDDMCAKELNNLLRESKDMKRRRILETHKPEWDHEPSGLDALASVAVLGDHPREGDYGDPSIGATTKHPRHRPGCTCIVCIQPPSGQGKHEATCTCNVCMTVKRRFKTLMLRKKKRQFEREAEHSQALKNRIAESETNGSSPALMHTNGLETEVSQSRRQVEVAETGTGQIDLNCDPSCEEAQVEEPEGSSVNLVQAAAALPLENYVKQNGFRNLECEQQDRPIPLILPASAGERGLAGDGQLAPLVQEVQENLREEYHKPSSD